MMIPKKKQISNHLIRLLFLGLMISLLLTGVIFFANSSFQKKKQADFASFTNDLFVSSLSSDGLSLHFFLTQPQNYGITLSEYGLGDAYPNYAAEHVQNENLRAALEGFRKKDLTLDEQVTLECLSSMLTANDALCGFPYYDEPLDSIHGVQVELPILLSEYRLQTREDLASYFELIEDVPRLFSDLETYEEQKSAKGLFMPDEVCQEVMKELICFSTEEGLSFLNESFTRRLEQNFPDLDKKELHSLQDRQQELIQTCLIPAYQSLLTCMSRLEETCRYEGGLCHLKNGKAYYEAVVRASTGSDRSLSEIADLISNYRQDSIDKLEIILKKDSDYLSEFSSYQLPASTPEGVLKYLQAETAHDFPSSLETDFQVRQVSPDMQDILSPAFYLTVPLDAASTPVIYINPAKQNSPLALFTTLAHEGFPGHLYETNCSYENAFLPIRYLYEPAGYTEGWATYTELLSYKYSGLSENAAMIARLQDIIHLSLYASIDLGVHWEGWDADIVYEFLCDYGIVDEALAESIYELVLQSPANYLKYVLGAFEFEEIKKEAQTKYGDAYTDLDFHQTLLRIGPAPFSVIRTYFDTYASSVKSA